MPGLLLGSRLGLGWRRGIRRARRGLPENIGVKQNWGKTKLYVESDTQSLRVGSS